MGSPTSQLDTLEFILSRDHPLARLTPEQWVRLFNKTLREAGGQFDYLKGVFGLNGLYRNAFERSDLADLAKQSQYDLLHLVQQWNGRHFVLHRNKTWGWFTLDPDANPPTIAEHSMGLATHELLPYLEADADFPGTRMLGYQLYAGILDGIEKGIEEAHARVRVLEDNLKYVRQQGLRVRAIYEPHPPLKDPRTS